MAKISLAGFKDPVRRPRYIIWALVAVLMIAGVMVPVLGVTSTRWFCAEACHKVQDDTIIAYQHSSHSKISCMACHMPVNANPVVFLLHKAEALGELALTVSNNFELPLNPESEVSLTMTPDKCTQCHSLETRNITPSPGIKIDHEVHTEKRVTCPLCHNRVAHREDFELTLTDPATGEPNKKHDDFASMTACFRCHGLEAGSPAPGTCLACHTADFELKPPSHLETGFVGEHGKMAEEANEKVAETLKEYGIEPVTPESKSEFLTIPEEEMVGEAIPPVGAINYCSTCHRQAFCTACHGTPMPHSAEFVEPKDRKDPAGHPVQSKLIPKKCVMCHGDNEKTHFCDECHHGKKVDYEFKPAVPWAKQHPAAVAKSGVKSCTEKCHTAKFCVDCHTGKNVVPDSHNAKTWTHPAKPTMTKYGSAPASATALHTVAANESMESCEVCHGTGGMSAKFCKSCHKLELPHTADFKKFHGQTGRKNPAVCKNCHGWPQLCSNCHHIGSSTTKPWLTVHGGSVAKNGATGCVEKCHKQSDCQSCHTKRKVVPASHKANAFVKAPGSKLGAHATQFTKDGTVCTYCHKGTAEELPNSKFCKSCHKLPMPHPIDDSKEKFPHKDGFEKKTYKKAQCANCHAQTFCDSCHHVGSVPAKPWVRYHPNIVKKSGAQACFECHEETYCSNCHVNLAKRGLLN